VIAGGGVRAVLEAAGVRDVFGKSLGNNNPINLVRATLLALSKLHSVDAEAERRGLPVEEMERRLYRKDFILQKAIREGKAVAIPTTPRTAPERPQREERGRRGGPGRGRGAGDRGGDNRGGDNRGGDRTGGGRGRA
jgi:hypothetical protein